MSDLTLTRVMTLTRVTTMILREYDQDTELPQLCDDAAIFQHCPNAPMQEGNWWHHFFNQTEYEQKTL